MKKLFNISNVLDEKCGCTMDRGKIPITRNFELEYRYFDRDSGYKYFNRKFEILLLEKRPSGLKYVLHMDNIDKKQMVPGFFKASHKQKNDIGVTTLNWNDIKTSFLDFIVDEIGEENRSSTKKALAKLASPRL